MKKLSVFLSILMVIGLVHQTSVFAGSAVKEKKAVTKKNNFGPKKKHAMASATTSAPAAPKAV